MKDYHLLIAGCGRLGTAVCRKILQIEKSTNRSRSQLICETATRSKHQTLKNFGLQTKTKNDAPVKADNILICFPPGPRYSEEVTRAMEQWNRSGTAVFVSSTGVYQENLGQFITEDSSLKKDSQLAEAELVALSKGAHALRLAGLYDRHTGPQHYWEKQSIIEKNPFGYINLIHRNDAAEATTTLLRSNKIAQAWNLSDDVPLTRKDITTKWSEYRLIPPPSFSNYDSSLIEKRINSQKFKKTFNWKCRWSSFNDFIDSLNKIQT
jgi:hypothetical protein